MKRNAAQLLAGGLVAGLLATGCGGGDTNQPLSNQEFVDQGNQICGGINQGIRSAVANLPNNGTRTTLRTLVREDVVPVITDGMGQIGDLDVEDAATASKAQAMVKAADRAAHEVDKDPVAYLRGAAIKGNPFQPAADIANELKLNKCFPTLQPGGFPSTGPSVQVTP